tara:strand:+ start:77 stop:898 length:822 start_codon:yes stop_codon:yes gene_type:complete
MGLLTNKIKEIFDYYIKSSLHVSLCVISFIFLIYIQNNIALNLTEILLVFISTYVSYNFIKFKEILIARSKPISNNLKSFFFTSVIFSFILIILFFKVEIRKQIVVILVIILTLAYSVSFFGLSRLRNYPLLKISTVSLSWSLMIVVFPFIDKLGSLKLFYYFISIFLITFVEIIPFEIRDMKNDLNVVKTIVHDYGISKTKKIGYLLLIIIFLVSLFYCINYNNFKNLISLTVVLILLGVLILKSEHNQNKYFSPFIVESIPIYWLIIEILL